MGHNGIQNGKVDAAEPHFGDVPFTGINLPLETFDISNLRNDCGFKPQICLEEGTLMTMEWLKTIDE